MHSNQAHVCDGVLLDTDELTFAAPYPEDAYELLAQPEMSGSLLQAPTGFRMRPTDSDSPSSIIRENDTLPLAAEHARNIAALRRPSYCYLAVHETEGPTYIKVGMSQHPEARVYGLQTGSPFPQTAVYVCRVAGRDRAFAVEQKILRQLAAFSTRGEWLRLPESLTVSDFVETCTSIASGLGEYEFVLGWQKSPRALNTAA